MFIFQVFSDKEEAALVKYIITMSKLFRGLTKMQTEQLAYKFAKNKNIKIPQNWICDEAAGEDWLKGFRKRKADITLQQPEPTSLARAAAFNSQNVENFFHNLREVYTRGNNISFQNIFNLDETGLSTVQKPRQIFAQAGTKQFIKLFNKIKNGFIFPEIDDIASVSYNDIACVLTNPSPVCSNCSTFKYFQVLR